MLLYPFIDRYILFPIAERIQKSSVLKEYNFLKKSEWWSRDEIEHYQNQRLKKLINHCFKNVPYYARLFREKNLTPEDIQNTNDFKKIPILTKDIIRNNFDNFKSNDIDKRIFFLEASGGSTGTPLRFITEITCWNAQWATTFRGFDWAKHKIGERIFTIGGHSLVKKNNVFSKQNIWNRYLMRNFKFSGSELNDATIKLLIKNYKLLKPKAIRGYASCFYALAKYIEHNNIKIEPVRNIFTTGEVLIGEYRKKIQEIFKAPVYDEYGASDGGIMANECYMHEGLHISEENCIIEICKNGNILSHGEVGHVIVTDLNNFAFPFIRYKSGDMAYIKKELCSCGRKTRVIGEVLGRAGKLLYSKEGAMIPPTILLLLLWKNLDTYKKEHQEIYTKINKFQIYQDEKGDITVRIKLINKNEDKNIFLYIIDNYKRAFIGSDIKLEFVEEIEPLPSGKEDYVITKFNYKETV